MLSDQLPFHQWKDQLTIISGNSWITNVFITSCTFFYGKQRIGPRLKQRGTCLPSIFRVSGCLLKLFKKWAPWRLGWSCQCSPDNHFTGEIPCFVIESQSTAQMKVMKTLLFQLMLFLIWYHINFSWNKLLKHQLYYYCNSY